MTVDVTQMMRIMMIMTMRMRMILMIMKMILMMMIMMISIIHNIDLKAVLKTEEDAISHFISFGKSEGRRYNKKMPGN